MDVTMPLMRAVTAVILMIGLGAMSSISVQPAAAQMPSVQDDPMEVTTDTPAYCHHLLDRVSNLIKLAANPVPPDVSDLTTAGRRMCAVGQTRGGIMRLRSALMILEQRNGAAYR
jgi:hypothetical protein